MAYCIRCYKDKLISEMKLRKICHLCAEKRKHYYKINRSKILDWQKHYYNVENKKLYNKKYYQKNKAKIIKNTLEYTKNRKKNDPIFKLRKRISADIWRMLKLSGASKNGSMLKYLPYTIQELKDHLENQFESWMTWRNWGTYNKNIWNDNNQSTWTWQLDHIISHSTFKYSSMEDQSFKDCWALSNLRPLSAKQNIIKNKY